MFKSIVLFLSLFSSNFFTGENDYELVSIPSDETRDIRQEVNNVKLIYNNESNYCIDFGDIDVFLDCDFCFLTYNEEMYYMYYYIDNTLFVNTYKQDSTMIDSVMIYKGTMFNIVNVIIVNNELILFGTTKHNEKDIIIISGIHDPTISFIGGNLNEELSFALFDEYFYLVVIKDTLSDGVFAHYGNEKAIVLVKMNQDFEIIKDIGINDEKVTSFNIHKGLLYLSTSDSIWLLNDDLDVLVTHDESSLKSIFIGENDVLIAFNDECVYLFDRLTLSKIGEFRINDDFNEQTEKYTFLKLNNSILARGTKAYNIDIIAFNNMILPEVYNEDFEDLTQIYSLFGECKYIDKYYETYFDRGIYGSYPVEIEFETKAGIAFIIQHTYIVPLLCNVQDNMVYKSGYHLFFNGIGYLDNKLILNNYNVTDIGNHLLRIKGGTESDEKEISFTIVNEQIPFIDETNIKADYYIDKNTDFTIQLSIKNINDYLDFQIERIEVINGNLISFEMKTPELIELVFRGYEKSGQYHIYINDLVTIIQNKEKKIPIKNAYTICVVPEKPIIELIQVDEKRYDISINDTDNTLRLLEIELISNNRNYLFTYPLGTNKISVTIEPGYYAATFAILYGNNLSEIKRIPLMITYFYTENLFEQEIEIGNISVKQYNETLQKLSIELDNDFQQANLLKITKDNKDIYIKENNLGSDYLLVSVSAFFFTFTISLIIKYFIRNKKRKLLDFS